MWFCQARFWALFTVFERINKLRHEPIFDKAQSSLSGSVKGDMPSKFLNGLFAVSENKIIELRRSKVGQSLIFITKSNMFRRQGPIMRNIS